MSDHELPAGIDLAVGPPRLPAHPPFSDALRRVLAGATAVVVSLSEVGSDPRDVIGLLPPLGEDDRQPDPAAVAAAVGAHVPADVDVSIAPLSWRLAVAALRVGPPVGGGPVEGLLAEAARRPRGLDRMWRRLGDREVWVPVEDASDLPTAPALGGSMQVATVPTGRPLPGLPVIERDGHPAVHVFSGPWQLLHADPPFAAAVRVEMSRVAAMLPAEVAVAIDVGCLHATMLAPSPSG